MSIWAYSRKHAFYFYYMLAVPNNLSIQFSIPLKIQVLPIVIFFYSATAGLLGL